MVETRFKKLFEPGRIGNMWVKNRLVMAPMGIVGLVENDGSLSQRAIDYYVERARGGVGLITTGVTFACTRFEPIWIEGRYFPFPRLDSRVGLVQLSRLVGFLHDYDCKLSLQLTAGMGRVLRTGHLESGQVASASVNTYFWRPEMSTRALTTEEVEVLVKSFSTAARYAKMAGVDAIELHGHEGYLFDQFMTGLWNRRTDKYGGQTLRQKMTFALEAIDTIQKATGGSVPIIFRMALTHKIPGGRLEEEGLEICRIIEDAGAAALHVDAGCYESWYWPHPPTYQPPACMIDMAAKAKQVVKIPVIGVGKMHYPDVAVRALEEGKADFIALGRGLLADPDWPNKVKFGKVDEIRPCIGCQECIARMFRLHLACAVNAACGDEQARRLVPAERQKKVVVVGGGPGGMEAARVARLRGHEVTLLEKAGELGGQLIPASAPDFKQDLGRLKRYYENQMRKLGVKVCLSTEATVDKVKSLRPDAVLLATGASPMIPDVPGIDSSKVARAIDVLMGKVPEGQNIIVVGGGTVGCELAVHLAQKGKRVTIIEMLPQVLNDIAHVEANRLMLMKMLEENKVSVLTKTTLIAVTDSGVRVKDASGSRDIPGDSVIIATGMVSKDGLEDLREAVDEVYRIGDCVKPGRVLDAVWQAHGRARAI